jgi:signal transduction histidine kinase
MIVSWAIDVGGALPSSARNTVQASFFDVARIRAEPLERILRGEPKSTKPGGTGLGTQIVYNAVAAHHGLFEGESTAGVGTTFRLKLPIHEHRRGEI